VISQETKKNVMLKMTTDVFGKKNSKHKKFLGLEMTTKNFSTR
jgi:hypothetical protein